MALSVQTVVRRAQQWGLLLVACVLFTCVEKCWQLWEGRGHLWPGRLLLDSSMLLMTAIAAMAWATQQLGHDKDNLRGEDQPPHICRGNSPYPLGSLGRPTSTAQTWLEW